MITKQNDLQDICDSIQNDTSIAIDTEFTRHNTYWPILSVLQLSDGKNHSIIDFQSTDLDPTPLVTLLRDLHKTKIVHSCRQDFQIFEKYWDIIPHNVFDTQLAANLLFPNDQMGLAPLLYNELGIELNKQQQHTDWTKRPLTPEQISYALSDVEHLHLLRDILTEKLDNKDRLSWLWEDQVILLDRSYYQIDLDSQWMKLKTGRPPSSLKPRTLLYLQQICRWRELQAQRKNRNRAAILSDEIIFEIAQNPPVSLEEFAVRFGYLKTEYLHHLWDTLNYAGQIHRDLWPSPKQKIKGKLSSLLEDIRLLQASVAEDIGISPKVLASNDDLKDFCLGKQNISFLKGWRYDVFGYKCEKAR